MGGPNAWLCGRGISGHCDITKGSFTEVHFLLQLKALDVKDGLFWRVHRQDRDNDDWKNWKKSGCWITLFLYYLYKSLTFVFNDTIKEPIFFSIFIFPNLP